MYPFPSRLPLFAAVPLASALALALGCGADPQPRTEGNARPLSYLHAPDPERELLVRDRSVVDDPRYTAWRADKFNTDLEGLWSFGRLMANVSPWEKPTPAQLTRFVVGWLKQWEVDRKVGAFTAPARPAMRSLVLDPWRKDSGCGPDLAPPGQIPNDGCVLRFDKAPFLLLSIVHRPDLRVKPRDGVAGKAGEGRFVFGVFGKEANGAPRKLTFTVIFEYALPISGWSDIVSWGERWHKLGRGDLPFGPKYNEELANVTREFTKWNLVPGRPNGTALLQIRTNEVSLSSDAPKTWEMREFGIGPDGQLGPLPLAREPDASYQGTALLATWLTQNATAVLNGAHEVPREMLAARALVLPDVAWSAPGVAAAVRDGFALATCSGCHLAETGGTAGTNFLHVKTRLPGTTAGLSPFLSAELAGMRKLDFAGMLQAKDADQLEDGPGLDQGRTY